ncbi:Diphthamide biosynthesis protein 2 [Ptychographa xylographoides]|nr:Diphthamide biosynthesis protein 2 [Ptychographa xylographoides]
MPGLPEAPPILSTPDTHIFEDPSPITTTQVSKISPEQFAVRYDIQRTIAEIRHGKWQRIALQFPDEMLPDAPRVFEALQEGLRKLVLQPRPSMADRRPTDQVVDEMLDLQISSGSLPEERLYILADTSYGACCVDEIAAEHISADVVVHYGRACLSPTARLPVIHVFTHQDLPLEPVLMAFKDTYQDLDTKVIVMGDVTYSSHLREVSEALQRSGYRNIFIPEILHDPSSALPNRTVPEEIQQHAPDLKDWKLFHISDPPQSLLLTLSSRLSSIHIYPTCYSDTSQLPKTLIASTALALRRRYALLTSLSTVPVFGILINTLSVKNYLHIVEHVKAQILAAGKKSYTFVVGKVNAAKVANFSEIGGWVVIGCWESSLVESKDFWKPVITPFELELALQGDGERVWSGRWRSDFQEILDKGLQVKVTRNQNGQNGHGRDREEIEIDDALDGGYLDSEPESAPPEFDLRTGKYISHTRPLRNPEHSVDLSKREIQGLGVSNQALFKRAKGDLAIVGGEVSPGAEFLRSQRTWRGLGSDFQIAYEEDANEQSTAIEEGRSGIPRGYRVGDATTTQ